MAAQRDPLGMTTADYHVSEKMFIINNLWQPHLLLPVWQ